MPIGYEYRCDDCDHKWLLFSTRIELGPTQWGKTEYTCFNCQTFLSIAKHIDRNSWGIWLDNNANVVANNSKVQRLADSFDRQLDTVTGLTPIEVRFDSVECPTCQADQLSTIPFGHHAMKCPRCRKYTGASVNNNELTIYVPVAD